MKKVFIDCGANSGQSVDNFMNYWKDWKDYEIHSFECLPKLFSYFDRFKTNPKFRFHTDAVWIEDGTVDFFTGSDVGSSVIKEKDSGELDKENPIKIPCIDISKWIRDNFSKDDYIILKMDTEGGEYETLDKLINDNTLEIVDELYIEFHDTKIGKTKDDTQKLLDRMKKYSNLKVFNEVNRKLNFTERRYPISKPPKNVVFIPNIDLDDNRNQSYSYSIKSWKHFCDKYDCELLVWEDLLLPVEKMKITWQRYYMFDILEANHIDYDQILIVDADTIVHPDCPNFFTETKGKYSVVKNNGSFEWVRRSMDGFSKLLFNGEVPFNVWDYINCGFQIVNKDHKEFFEYVRNYYLENQEVIQNAIDQVKAGTDQTIINFLLRKQDIELNYLPTCYNLQDLHSKQLLFLHPQMWFEDKLIFENCGYVFHFNAIPSNDMGRDANYWIKRTYEEFYG